MKTLLRQTNPELESVVEIALKQERLQNEKKNQKILQMFQTKDNTINELQFKIEEMDVSFQGRIVVDFIREIIRKLLKSLKNKELILKELKKVLKRIKEKQSL